MRIFGFSKKWGKLQQPDFTSFRYPRADSDKGRDWRVGETVQIVFHPRSKEREIMGTAEIIGKEPRNLELSGKFTDAALLITDEEAIADGFTSAVEMHDWMVETYRCNFEDIINKLTFRWIERAEVSC